MYFCSVCQYSSVSWLGKCPGCGAWNTFVKQEEVVKTKSKIKIAQLKTISFAQIQVESAHQDRLPTRMGELDRVLGGGLVRGSVTLLTGEPGIGKSTLLLQGLQHLRTLYISGEESAQQIKLRAQRLKINLDNFFFSDTLQIEGVLMGLSDFRDKIDVVVIDSVQTIYSTDIESPAGSMAQLRELANQIIVTAKRLRMVFVVVGHVTKDGDIAGPKTLEHMVDVVLHFEGERVSQYRLLRARKNRFGSTVEVGIWEMTYRGLQEVSDPLAFIDDQPDNLIGKAVAGVVEGYRPLFFEVQALASPTSLPLPRRVVRGLDYNKVLLILAVLRKQLRLEFDKFDVYLNVIGGLEVKSPAVDLALAAALISSIKNLPLSAKMLFVGELGLLGEVRKVAGLERVLDEAKRLKFSPIIDPTQTRNVKELLKILNT